MLANIKPFIMEHDDSRGQGGAYRRRSHSCLLSWMAYPRSVLPSARRHFLRPMDRAERTAKSDIRLWLPQASDAVDIGPHALNVHPTIPAVWFQTGAHKGAICFSEPT